MNRQLAIAFPADDVGRRAWSQAIEAIRGAVMHLGIKEVAFWLDIAHTHLSDAMHERERKVWHAHWTLVVMALLKERTDDVAAELLRTLAAAIVEPSGFGLSEAVEMTPEEEAAALRRELLKFGDAGRSAVERVTKRKGRR